MKIHEYQAKALLKDVGVPTPEGVLLQSGENPKSKAQELSSTGPWVVKAQVHAGGRGKGGGVKVCKTLDEVQEAAETIFGRKLVTPQTGKEGVDVNMLWIESGCDIAREFYLAAVFDRQTSSIVIMASQEGGMEIEEVAAESPEKILKAHVDPGQKLPGYVVRKLGEGLGLDKAVQSQFKTFLTGLLDVFSSKDCSLAEINPLVLTGSGDLIALDAKINFDENALFRHPSVAELRDIREEDPRDVEASKWNLNYIRLDGNIGCMVNGAGLAMATMDIIKLYGGDPANFLDVGGGATTEMVSEAFKILMGDENVKGILVNIFGGIMKCDVLAQGIVDAAKQVSLSLPLVVRLEGTNVERGRQILEESGLAITTASNMGEAAETVVAAVKGA